MVIKVFFTVLVLCTVAVVAVILAIHFRVKRHLEQPATNPAPEVAEREEPVAAEVHRENAHRENARLDNAHPDRARLANPGANGDGAVEPKRP
ncbi:MAG: hypothetical protein WAL85_09565 [Candidatus Korobacteraceae bacterium]